jgi:pullulanase/glycogen debranching enzyme
VGAEADRVLPGSPFPLGATPEAGGTNFAVASGVALVAQGLTNYWGYNTTGYFAPHNGYSAAVRAGRGGQVAEFKAMVNALHAAGLEVLLDVVFNHTAEADHRGPTLCFRGLDNAAYYRLAAGSSDLYGGTDRRKPTASVNLLTVHDGFTMADLVSYDGKHNETNGEANRDGTDDNRSWNCGA